MWRVWTRALAGAGLQAGGRAQGFVSGRVLSRQGSCKSAEAGRKECEGMQGALGNTTTGATWGSQQRQKSGSSKATSTQAAAGAARAGAVCRCMLGQAGVGRVILNLRTRRCARAHAAMQPPAIPPGVRPRAAGAQKRAGRWYRYCLLVVSSRGCCGSVAGTKIAGGKPLTRPGRPSRGPRLGARLELLVLRPNARLPAPVACRQEPAAAARLGAAARSLVLDRRARRQQHGRSAGRGRVGANALVHILLARRNLQDLPEPGRGGGRWWGKVGRGGQAQGQGAGGQAQGPGARARRGQRRASLHMHA